MRALLLAALLASAASADDLKPPKILWIVGQGEMPLEDLPNGASAFRQSLGRAFPGWQVEAGRMQDLLDPAGKVGIIAGPYRDVSEAELGQLREAISKGARLLVCIDPVLEHRGAPLKRLRLALRETGVEVGAGTIMDPNNACVLPGPNGPDTFPPPGSWIFAGDFRRQDHPLLTIVPEGIKLFFSNACRVAPVTRPQDPFQVVALVSSSDTAFSRDPAGVPGPAGPVAVAVQRKDNGGRLVVAGDASFLANGFASRPGVGDSPLALAALAWLAEGIRMPLPPPAATPSAPVADSTPTLVIVFASVVAAILVAGVFVFRPRRT